MSGAAHTPGPWAFNDDDGTISAQGGVVADVNCSDFTLRRDEHNARLIAAAPDMLAALKLISGMDIYHEALAAVDAAIAKAEGRS